MRTGRAETGISPIDYHPLLVLAGGDTHATVLRLLDTLVGIGRRFKVRNCNLAGRKLPLRTELQTHIGRLRRRFLRLC